MKEKIRNLFDEMKVRSRYKSMGDIINMIEPIVNQEVEKRIKERMPSDEVNQPIFQRPEKKYTYQDIDIAYANGVFNVVGIDGLSKELKRLSDIGKSPHDIFNSRLTCSEKPNNSKGGEG